jgi:hypothetical protein
MYIHVCIYIHTYIHTYLHAAVAVIGGDLQKRQKRPRKRDLLAAVAVIGGDGGFVEATKLPAERRGLDVAAAARQDCEIKKRSLKKKSRCRATRL